MPQREFFCIRGQCFVICVSLAVKWHCTKFRLAGHEAAYPDGEPVEVRARCFTVHTVGQESGKRATGLAKSIHTRRTVNANDDPSFIVLTHRMYEVREMMCCARLTLAHACTREMMGRDKGHARALVLSHMSSGHLQVALNSCVTDEQPKLECVHLLTSPLCKVRTCHPDGQ